MLLCKCKESVYCTLCYLSESAESVRDIPMQEVLRRLDEVKAHYGAGTNVQITGGDPTLRKHSELVRIVRYASDLGLYPALFTNGIAASRKLLTALSDNGLSDVAFHVDTTQRRAGYRSEADLNAVRKACIERVRGLPLLVVFNTTVHCGNLNEIPELVRFFAAHADAVGMASFQLQAETGRGEWGRRDTEVSLDSVRRQIEAGGGQPLPWTSVAIGHPQCHSYVPTLAINGRCHGLVDDPELFNDFLRDFANLRVDRRQSAARILLRHVWEARTKPVWYWRGLCYVVRRIWRARRDLWEAGGRAGKLSLFVQNFMDADNLDPERIGACSFTVMSASGPVSMCAHNARRDEYILKPIILRDADGRSVIFEPLKTKAPKRHPQSTQ